MRVSREVAAKNRQRVVDTASREFRTHGYDGIGVAGLMKAAGMTHGGFYKQFEHKDALAVEATAQALGRNFTHWQRQLDDAGGDPLGTLRHWYLSQAHLEERGKGCTYAALAAEAPRHGEALQEVFTDALERQVEDIAERIDGSDDARAEVLRTVSQVIGAMILARAVSDPELRDEILDAARAP